MTKKERFEYNYKTGRICDNESNFQCTSNMRHIVTKLNNVDKKCKQLQSENEQLKQFKDKTFNLLNKEIAKNEEAMEVFGKQGAGIGAMGFHTNMLKILRKELQE